MSHSREGTIDIDANESTIELVRSARYLRMLLNKTLCVEQLPSRSYRKAFEVLKSREFAKVVRSGSFKLDGQALQGLIKTLDILFHSMPLNVNTGGSRTGGCLRGINVDTQLAHIINNGTMPNLIDGFTVNVLRALVAQKLVPFMAQANIGSVDIGVGTALDLVCIDIGPNANPDNNVVSVQLKTFGTINHNKPHGCFHSLVDKCNVLTNTPDTLIQRGLLQVMCEFAITKHAHNNVLCDARLLVVTSRNIYSPLSMVANWYNMPAHFPEVVTVFINSCKYLKTANQEHIEQLLGQQRLLRNKRRNALR
jgi:hypothetical protein